MVDSNRESEMQLRIKTLEEAISRIELQQDTCRPLLKLAGNPEQLSKIREVISGLSKKYQDIEHRYELNQNKLKANKESVSNSMDDVQGCIQNEVLRREQTVGTLNDRLATIENSFKHIEEENKKAVELIQNRLKAEVKELSDGVNARIKGEKDLIQGIINKTKTDVESEVNKVKKSEQLLEKTLNDFEKRHTGVLKKAGGEAAKQRGAEMADLRTSILSAITSRIQKSIEESKSNIDKTYNELFFKYSKDFEQLRGEMLELKQGLIERENI